MMELLHVFPTFAVGGAQMRTTTLINHFGDRHHHTILSLDGRLEAASRLDGSAPVTLLAGPVARDAMAALLRRRRPDLLLTYNWGAIEWAVANAFGPRVRHVHAEDGFGVEEAVRRKARRGWFRRVALVAADRVVVPSDTLADIARREWWVPAGRLRRIDNGIDLRRFTPPAEAPPGREVVIGTVAPLRPEKNLSRLLRAFAAIRLPTPPRLIIVGDGAERNRLEELAGFLGLGGRVRFAGHAADPERLAAGFDVFALSSDTEQQPTTVIEAMAMGRAIAAVDVGDIRAMVAPENRDFIVPRDDAAALTRALEDLGRDSTLRATLGRANRAAAVERFDAERMFAAYARLYDGE